MQTLVQLQIDPPPDPPKPKPQSYNKSTLEMDYYTIYVLSGLIISSYVVIISIIIRDLRRFEKVCLIISLLLISQVAEVIFG